MNYREETNPGTCWRRCHEVVLVNPFEGAQFARFAEQDVAAVGDRALTTPAGYIDKPFELAGEFPLLDPETGLPTGQSLTHAGLYQALFSLYMQTAQARDATLPE